MRRYLVCLFVLAVLLCGCSQENPVETEPPGEQTTEPVSEPERQPSLYAPEHSIELRTLGAVRAYIPDDDCGDIAFMGNRLLLFSYDGFGPTRLVRLSGEDYSVEASVELMGKVLPGEGGLRITDSRLGYYSDVENEIILLDKDFREISRTKLPGNSTGLPVLAANLREAYYCTGTDIRVIDLDTGISRLLRQRSCESVTLLGTWKNDDVLICRVAESEDVWFTEFLDTENGQTLGSDSQLQTISLWKDRYYLQRQEGILTEMVFGSGDAPAMCIVPEPDAGTIYSLLEMNALLGVREDSLLGTVLQLYDLDSGTLRSQIQLATISGAHAFTADPGGEYVWFLAPDELGYRTLYRWELSVSETQDRTVYTDLRYTAAEPDREGLDACRARADQLEAQYGIEILMEQNPVAPAEYAFAYEHQVAAVTYGLDTLEQILTGFPEDFFQTVGMLSDNEKLSIGLLRGLRSRSNAVSHLSDGAQYWSGGNAYIVLSIGEDMASAFYRELAHVLDTYILNEALAYDDWSDLNPDGFLYDESYAKYADREDVTWLEGEQRAFVNSFAMSYAREDRAAVFQSAMEPGNETVFQNRMLQEKLLRVCKGIREAFGWKKDSRVFPWEQYLTHPLAYGS